MSRAILLLLATALSVNAQPGDRQIDLKPDGVTTADVAALQKRLLMLETQKFLQLQKVLEELQKNPQAGLEMMKQLPPETKAELSKRMPEEMKGLPEIQEFTKGLPPNVGTSSEASPELPRLTSRPGKSNKALEEWLEKSPAGRNLKKLWERNLGSLNKNPGLKKMLGDLFESGLNTKGSGGPFENEQLNALFHPDTPLGRELSNWLESAANDTSWNWNDLGLDNLNVKLPESGLTANAPTYNAPVFNGSGTGDVSPMKAIVAVMAVLACVLLLRRAGYLPWFELPKKKKGIPGLSISLECEVQDRATLVRAFELLSLRVLGDDAATWHHRAIGAALAQRTASGEAAAAAARLYELARYAPPAEPWTDATTAEARRYLALLRAGRP